MVDWLALYTRYWNSWGILLQWKVKTEMKCRKINGSGLLEKFWFPLSRILKEFRKKYQISQRADAILIFAQVMVWFSSILVLQISCGVFKHFKRVGKNFTPLWLALWLVPMRKGLSKYELSMLSPYNISMSHDHVSSFEFCYTYPRRQF